MSKRINTTNYKSAVAGTQPLTSTLQTHTLLLIAIAIVYWYWSPTLRCHSCCGLCPVGCGSTNRLWPLASGQWTLITDVQSE